MWVPFHSALVGTPVQAPGQENAASSAPAAMGTSLSFSGSPFDINAFFNDIIAEEVLGGPSSSNVFGLFGQPNHLLSPNTRKADEGLAVPQCSPAAAVAADVHRRHVIVNVEIQTVQPIRVGLFGI